MVLNSHSRIRRMLNRYPVLSGINRAHIRPGLALAKAVLYRKRNEAYARQMIENSEALFTEIEIETINRCNGKCTFCPVNVHQPQRPYAKMEEELFRKIIVELGELNYSGVLNVFSNNEPLLDRRIYDFYDFARETCPNAFITICTNGTGLTVERIERLAKSCDQIVIDNYNDELKLNPGLEDVFEYVEKRADLSQKVQFAFRLENEIITSRGGEAPNAKPEKVTRGICVLPFCQMIVRPTGEVSLCCNDALGAYTMGDVSRDSLLSVWQSQRYRGLRREMYDNHRKNLNLCRHCDTMFPIEMFLPPERENTSA